MLTTHPQPVEGSSQPEPGKEPTEVMLADGSWQSLAGMTAEQLHTLQWEQEQKFARAILALPKASDQRNLVIGQAYDTVCTILAAQQDSSQPLVMGCDRRYARLVLEVLNRQIHRGIGRPHFFEIGFGCGALLKEVHDHGHPISGLEVSAAMRDAGVRELGERFADRLLLGDLHNLTADALPERPSLIYWNDVFEHVCPDEISDYLKLIHKLLVPGGELITITPNWLLRPSDVTGDFCPPRTEARGLHLKEYRLAEVTRLLKQAGFRNVAAPLVVSRQRYFLAGNGARIFKQWLEPLLDRLPLRTTEILCSGLGMSCTIARK